MASATFLEASRPWKKIFTQKSSSNTYNQATFTSYEEKFFDLKELYEVFKKNAELGRAYLRGTLNNPIKKGPRRGITNPRAPTEVVFLDIDGVETLDNSEQSIKTILGALSLAEYGYFVHYSSSAGVKSGMRAHIVLKLDEPVQLNTVSSWLKHIQMSHKLTKGCIDLDVGGRTLLFPVDDASSRPSTLFTIANPDFVAPRKDPYAVKQRWSYHEGAEVPAKRITTEVVRGYKEDYTDLVNALRRAKGFSKVRKAPEASPTAQEDQYGSWNFIKDPSEAMLTSTETLDDFVRVNINGGDSNAYWHPVDNPNYLYSFKGWLKYPMRKILPEYLASLEEGGANDINESARDLEKGFSTSRPLYFVAEGDRSVKYRIGAGENHNWSNVTRFTTPDGFTTILNNDGYLDAYRRGKLPVPEVSLITDPVNGFCVLSPTGGYVNQFLPPVLLPDGERVTELPDWFTKLLRHVMAGSAAYAEQFLDWFAYLFQSWDRPGTAWLWHGTQGTGKGLLLNTLGKVVDNGKYVMVMMSNAGLDGRTVFNEILHNRLLVAVDEVCLDDFRSKMVIARLNSYVTEPTIKIHGKGRNEIVSKNHMGMVFTSNRPDAIPVPVNDRRFHVPPRQEVPIKGEVFTEEELDTIGRLTPTSDDIVRIRTFFSQYTVSGIHKTPAMSESKESTIYDGSVMEERFVNCLSGGRGGFSWSEIMDGLPEVGEVVEGNQANRFALEGFREFCYTLKEYHEHGTEGKITTISAKSNQLEFLYRLGVDGKAVVGGRRFMVSLRHSGYNKEQTTQMQLKYNSDSGEYEPKRVKAFTVDSLMVMKKREMQEVIEVLEDKGFYDSSVEFR